MRQLYIVHVYYNVAICSNFATAGKIVSSHYLHIADILMHKVNSQSMLSACIIINTYAFMHTHAHLYHAYVHAYI